MGFLMPDGTLNLQNRGADVAVGALTMDDLIAKIVRDPELTAVRRRNVASSIRRFCDVLQLDPAGTPANFSTFRAGLVGFHPLSVGVQKKRWQTIRSDVTFALKYAGVSSVEPKRRLAVEPEWRALYDQMKADGLKWAWGLSRLARFCSDRGIAPQQVAPAVLQNYLDHLRHQTFKTKPERSFRAVCVLWNKLAARYPDLNLQVVSLPSGREIYSPQWEELPEGFRLAADRWLVSMSQEADLLDEHGPIKPLRPKSIQTYRYTLRQIVGALLQRGWDLPTVDSLAVLVRPETYRAALEFFAARSKGKPSVTLAQVAHVLVLVAVNVVHADAGVIDKLKLVRRRVSQRPDGMRQRPKAALRPFADRANIEKILLLPQRIHARLKRKVSYTKADARLMQVAVALELLLMRPIRRSNLIGLRLGEHVIMAGDKISISIAAEDVKNSYALDYPIPRESAALIHFYVKRLLPLLGPNPERFLFPGEVPGQPKAAEGLARQFTKVIQAETGLYLYPHVMRHFGANLYLREHPHAFETVRRVLAHKSLTTTTRSYANLEDEAAVQLFDSLVLRIRAGIQKEVGGA